MLTIACAYTSDSSLTAAIKDVATGLYFDPASDTWGSSAVAITMAEVSSGLYSVDVANLGVTGWLSVLISDTGLSAVVGCQSVRVVAGVEDCVSTESGVSAVPASVDSVLTAAHGGGLWTNQYGAGASSVLISILVSGVPITTGTVWVTTDSAGTLVVAGPVALSQSGTVSLFLTNGATYYLSAFLGTGTNPIVNEAFVASHASGNTFSTTATGTVIDPDETEYTASIMTLLPYVSPYLKACEEPIQKDALRKVASDFARESEIWQATYTTTVATATTTISPTISYSAGLLRVRYLTVDDCVADERMMYTVSHTGTITFLNELKVGTVVIVYYNILPRRSCETYPEWLIDTWGSAIVEGTLSRLFAMAGKPWFNSQSSQYHMNEFNEYISLAKREAHKQRQVKNLPAFDPRFI
jgi:hypothetical protein